MLLGSLMVLFEGDTISGCRKYPDKTIDEELEKVSLTEDTTFKAQGRLLPC